MAHDLGRHRPAPPHPVAAVGVGADKDQRRTGIGGELEDRPRRMVTVECFVLDIVTDAASKP